jgi:uncharacterized membrane-anchored protein YhcB (DUF1043 family)
MNEIIMYYGPFVLLVLTIVVISLIIALFARSLRRYKRLQEEIETLKGKSVNE